MDGLNVSFTLIDKTINGKQVPFAVFRWNYTLGVLKINALDVNFKGIPAKYHKWWAAQICHVMESAFSEGREQGVRFTQAKLRQIIGI